MEPQQSSITKKIIGGVVGLAVVAGVTTFAMRDNKSPQVPTTTQTETDSIPTEQEHTDVTNKTTQKPETTLIRRTSRDDDEDEEENDDDDNTQVTQKPVVPVVKNTSASPVIKPITTQTHAYKDGTYSAAGSYNSPAGQENVSLSLVIKNDIVVDSTFSATSDSSRSLQYQAQFSSGYKTQVIGKNLANISVGKVSGASLTGKGFNDALAKIKILH